MSIHLPSRRYLTFAELQARWACEPNDIRDLVCGGTLVPSVHIADSLPWAQWTADETSGRIEPKLVPEIRSGLDGLDWYSEVNGWLYLRCPFETGALACRFDMLCTSATDPPEEDGQTPPIADWYYLKLKPSIETVEQDGVFMLTEVDRVEALLANPAAQSNSDDRSVGTRERNTLLSVIRVLCSIAALPLEHPSKAAEAIGAEADRLGVTLPRRTIEEKLKQIPDAVAARSK